MLAVFTWLAVSVSWADDTVKITCIGSPNTDWSTTWYDVDTASIAKGLGISTEELTTLYGKDLFVYADAGNGQLQDAQTGSAYKDIYKGSWMNKDGQAIGFDSNNCYYFYIVNYDSRQIGMGQYPRRLQPGDSYNFKLYAQLRPDSGAVKATVTLDVTYIMSYEGPYNEAVAQLRQLLNDSRLENLPDDVRTEYEALVNQDTPSTEEALKAAIEKIDVAVADLQKRMLPTPDATYTFDTKPASDYATTWYPIDTKAMAEALELDSASLVEYYNSNNVTYSAYDGNAALVSTVNGTTAYTNPSATDTVRYVGFWFDTDGHITSYGNDAYYFINFDPKGRLGCGQYPGHVTVGSSYPTYLTFENIQNGKQYVLLVNYNCTNKLVYADMLQEAQEALNDDAYADASPSLRSEIQQIVDAGMPADGNYDSAVEKLRQLLVDFRSGSANIVDYAIVDDGMRNNSDEGGYERRYFHIPLDQVAEKLEVPADSIPALYNSGKIVLATYDSLYNKVSTADAWGDGYSGFWVNRKGFYDVWDSGNGTAYVFYVLNADSSSVGIGQYPGRVMPSADLSFYMIFTYTPDEGSSKTVSLKIHYTTDNHLTLNENNTSDMTGTRLENVIPTVVKSLNNGWNGIVLPFSVSRSQLVDNYGEGVMLMKLVKVGKTIGSVYFTKTDSIEANVPCLIYVDDPAEELKLTEPVDIYFGDASVQTDSVSFTGTYTAIAAPTGAKLMDGDIFTTTYDGTTINAFNAYLTLTWPEGEDLGDVEMVEISKEEAIALGISDATIYKAVSNGKIYDLSGRQVSHPVKGVYIKDGKKFVK